MSADDYDKPRSVFDDGNPGTVLKKKRRRVVDVGPIEPRARKAPTCGICGGAHYTRGCKVGT